VLAANAPLFIRVRVVTAWLAARRVMTSTGRRAAGGGPAGRAAHRFSVHGTVRGDGQPDEREAHLMG
jgi:hypothetical protein